MAEQNPDIDYRGAKVRTPWSSNVVILDVLFSTTVLDKVFYGVKTETRDAMGVDWPVTQSLLWLFKHNGGLQMWQDFRHQPLIAATETFPVIETVIGCHEMNGNLHYAIKWRDHLVPTWELEAKLYNYVDTLTDYDLLMTYSKHLH